MHPAYVCLCQVAALWVSGSEALIPPSPRFPAVDIPDTQSHHVVARDMSTMGFVTFKMDQTVSTRDTQDEPPTAAKVSRIVQGLAKKYNSDLPTRTTEQGASLVNRGNTYSVETPTTPTQSNAAGIYQDGTDYSYFIQAYFGSASTPLYVLIDTGASTSWVMGSGCTSDACKTHNTFGSEDSETLKDTGSSFSVEYGSGSVSGHTVTDSIRVADLNVTYTFGLSNVTSSQFSSFPFDGILGLSRSSGNFNEALKNSEAISSNVFAVSLARHSDGTNNGEISFGGTDPAKYTGDITYTSVTQDSSWVITMDDVTVGGTSAGLNNRTAYIDTGTTYAFGPPADVSAMYKLIPDANSTDNGVTWTYPCDTTATIALTFSGKSYSINAKDLTSSTSTTGRCSGNIFGMEVVSGAWLLGDLFLKNVYAVFDNDESRIGFASKPAVTATSTASATQSTVATVTASDGTTSVTTMPAMGFTGSYGGSTGTHGTSTTGSTSATSTSGKSSGVRPEVGVMFISVTCIMSAIVMLI